jgi:hypothetical protein
MKKIISLLFVETFIAIIIFSCNKENDKSTRPVNSMDDSQLNSLVLTFIEQMDACKAGSYYKSGSPMSIDSARWYIQSSMNYMYSFAGTPYFNIQSDSVYVDLRLVNSNSTQSSYVLEALDESTEKVALIYDSIEETKKWLIGITVEDIGPSSQIGYEKFRVISHIGLNDFNPYDGFDEDEKWWYTTQGGNCDGYGDYGAPDILASFLNPNYTDCCVYWWDNFTTIFFQNPLLYEINPGSNYLGYQLYYAYSGFFGGITDETKCLDYNPDDGIHEMQFYLDQGQDLIDGALLEYPGKLLFKTEMWSLDKIIGSSEENLHQMLITIGTRHQRSPGPYPIIIGIDEK